MCIVLLNKDLNEKKILTVFLIPTAAIEQKVVIRQKDLL